MPPPLYTLSVRSIELTSQKRFGAKASGFVTQDRENTMGKREKLISTLVVTIFAVAVPLLVYALAAP